MEYVDINEIRQDLIKLIKDQSIYPVIGAGFSSGCKAKNGVVPSAEGFREEILNQIKDLGEDTSEILNSDLKTLAQYYKKIIPRNIRTNYLINNFTSISLSEHCKKFLEIEWKYVYTFNIDTCIEENSSYKDIILPNKPCDENTIRKLDHCIYKIHGDVVDYCKYQDSKCYIFDNKEYIQSIKNNTYILNKINHDFAFNNLIFIGCSLTNELDILSLSTLDDNLPKTSRFYVTDKKPNKFKELDLEQYGITHVILINNYDNFYDEFYKIFIDSKKLHESELDKFKNIKIKSDSETYDENIVYLHYSKFPLDTSDFTLNIPKFFIDRDIVIKDIIPDMEKYCIQFVCGGRVSGKTYSLITIVRKIRDRDVYLFDSRYNLSNNTLNEILTKERSVLCFDTACITKDQIYYLKKNIDILTKNKLNVLICINRSDKDIISSIKNIAENTQIKIYDLDNKFNPKECQQLNKLLAPLSIPNFDYNKTLLDNLLQIAEISNKLYQDIKFDFDIENVYYMVILILLAIKEKLTSQEFVDFGIEKEVYELLNKLSPIIDEDYTSIIERDTLDSSSYKIYANSRYWLLNKLGSYASDSSKHNLIIQAYRHIIDSLIKVHSTKYKSIEDYIKYDIINEIFFRPARGNLLLIKSLYDGLNDLLSSNPQFYHQKAKCYLWHCNYSHDKESEIKDALYFARLAKHNMKLRHNINNTKTTISLAHIDFTLALIYAKYNHILKYKDVDLFKSSLPVIKDALSNPYNNEYFFGLLEKNNKKINDINNFFNFVTSNSLECYHLSSEERKQLNEIINIIFCAKK